MSKFFIQLVALLFLSALFSQQVVWPTYQSLVFDKHQKWGYQHFAKGTIDLLAEQLNAKKGNERVELFNKMKRQFGYDIELALIDEIGLDEKADQKLRLGQLVTTLNNRSVYKLLDDKKQVLYFADLDKSAEHIVTEAQWRIMGTVNVLKHELFNVEQSQWNSVLKNVVDKFSYPIQILPITDLALEKKQFKDLYSGEIVWQQSDDSKELEYPFDKAFVRLKDSNTALVIGPVTKEILERVTPIYLSYFLVLSLSILLPLLIWILPTLITMRRMKKTTESFGKGELNSRISAVRGNHINNLAKTFNTMANKISELIGVNKSLVNAVSHELRTPLSRIEFDLELARQSDDPEILSKHHDRIETSVDELRSLITEMLAYAKFDHQKPQLDFIRVDLGQWLNSGLSTWISTGRDKSVKIMPEQQPIFAWIDNFYMDRTLSNLIRNALKYANKHVVISYGIQDKVIYVKVEDDGLGIIKNDRERVFDAFVRLDSSRNRESGGTGLGLAIVKQIMQWHHGKINVEASVLGGAMFILSWPINQEEVI